MGKHSLFVALAALVVGVLLSFVAGEVRRRFQLCILEFIHYFPQPISQSFYTHSDKYTDLARQSLIWIGIKQWVAAFVLSREPGHKPSLEATSHALFLSSLFGLKKKVSAYNTILSFFIFVS